MIDLALDQDLPSMFPDNTVTDGKPEPGSPLFRREKRVEYFGNNGLGYPDTGVGDVDSNLVWRFFPDRDGQNTPPRHGLYAIDNQVQKNLLELAEVSLNHGPAFVGRIPQFHVTQFHFMLRESQSGGEQFRY